LVGILQHPSELLILRFGFKEPNRSAMDCCAVAA
jgi:hypothetical protein